MDVNIRKDNMLKLRMDAATAELMDRARSHVRLDRSKFVRHSIREKAEAIIAEYEKTRFTSEDWLMFFDMIDHPPVPTERMRKAAQTYKDIMSSNAV